MKNETGWWRWGDERWYVIRRPHGSINATSENGSYTAASADTWERWKSDGSWILDGEFRKAKEK